jgi:hypothetical protein
MKFFCVTLLVFVVHMSYSQQGQISISRIEQMPNEPAPYMMRDWKEVTQQYDKLIFDPARTGTHLPLISLKPAGINYPALQPIQLDTYVGTTSETQAEAINIIPAIVGSSLTGIDKANQNGVNWVEKIKDFYNSANGQNVYLNGTNSTSGSDWWYDVMPNVFFYQAYSLYPDIPDFDAQFIGVADRWLSAVYAMGGKATPWTIPNMNYRGWYLSTMTRNTNGVKEPEAAGSIGWLLFQAYSVTGDKKYLEGAQLCLDYLNGLTSNPSYELQLPYGTLTAATLNATQGSDYDIEKMLNWSFNRGQLRGWGTIVGKWDGVDVSGLVGEANDAGNDYAFMMNGYQQAAALAPVAKYDKRFARALSKWILNLSNASRLYYPTSLAADKQDDYAWSIQYDPESSIGYEALKENWDGKVLYGTGDAKRNGWAATNLALYGSSSVGYLAAIVEPTNVEKILKLDLNKTDFFADIAFPVYLLFNPHAANQQVTLNEGSGPFDIYDAISETVIATGVSGDFSVDIKPDESVLLTVLPAGTALMEKGPKLMAGDHVVDYHYGYDFSPEFRIKSIAAVETAEFNDVENIYVTIESSPAAVTYKWYVNEEFKSETESGVFSWTAPAVVGENEIRVEAISNGVVRKDSLTISVVAIIPDAPVVVQMSADKIYYLSGSQAKIITLVEDAEKEKFTYEYTVPVGTFEQTDSLINWIVPGEGLYSVRCVVKNIFDLTTEATLDVLVKVPATGTTAPLAYYPLNNNVEDYSGNDFHGSLEGTQQADDALGMNDFAYRISNATDIIFVNNASALNFTDAITISFWMSPGSVGHEAFLLSHGSWEERWKISITPEKRLRWTVKTEAGVKDLDSREPVTVNTYVHVTAVYTGYSMELYLDGELDNVTGQNGSMLTTSKQITFGQKDYSDRLYYYNGVLDEVRLYDVTLQPDEIALLKELWAEEEPTAVSPELNALIRVYPNPVSNGMLTVIAPGEKVLDIRLFAPEGREVPIEWNDHQGEMFIQLKGSPKGLFFLKAVTTRGDAWAKVLIN